jgi:hypothetical protein
MADSTGLGLHPPYESADKGFTTSAHEPNPQLNAEEIGPCAAAIWESARLRDRIDAVIAHEYEESLAGTHKGAEMRAADTALPISDKARLILHARADRENHGGRR